MTTPPKNFVATPFAYHEELELTIQALTNEGKGVGRVDNWAVMVPFVIPGEVVRIRIFRNHKNYSEADLVEILKPSPARETPLCPLFGLCGGCQYQHMSYAEQLKWKRQQAIDCIERIGKLKAEVQPLISSDKIYGYRTKLTPHFERSSAHCPIGFLREGSRRIIVDVPHCPIASEAINKKLPEMRQQVLQSSVKHGTLLLRDCDVGVLTDHHAIATTTIGGLQFKFPAGSFFQNNSFILAQIFTFLSTWMQAHPVLENLVDTYCGVGVFAIALAAHVKDFLGIEIDEKSIRLAEENKRLNRIAHGRFLTGDAQQIFQQMPFEADKTCVLMDPPRKGISEEFLRSLLHYAPKAVVYISCAPDTQARDLNRFLTLAPQYHLKEIQPFDMFPQTKHMECIAILER